MLSRQSKTENKKGFKIDSKTLLYGDTFDPDFELYTPDYLVEVLVPHLKKFEERLGKKITIWLPFDTDRDIEFSKGTLRHSEYHKILSKHFKVIVSHIFTGQDIFEYEPEEDYDCVCSNSPFLQKSLYIKRVLTFNKPFLLLQPFAIFNDRNPIGLINDTGRQVQVLKFNQRAKFIKPMG